MREWVVAACMALAMLTVPTAEAQAFNFRGENDRIVVANYCFLPMRVLVRFQDRRTGNWTTSDWHAVGPDDETVLHDDRRTLLSGSDSLYFYVDFPSYGLEIRGHDAGYSEFVDGRQRVFLKVRYRRTGFWTSILGQDAGGLLTRAWGVDEYVKGFNCNRIEEKIRGEVSMRAIDECPGRDDPSMLGIAELHKREWCEEQIYEQEIAAWKAENRID